MRGRVAALALAVAWPLSGGAAENAEDLSACLTFRDVYRGSIFLTGLEDTGKIVTRPVHWSAAQWAAGGGFLLATYGLMTCDGSLYRLIQRNKSRDTRHLANVVHNAGNGGYMAATLVVCGIGGHYAGWSTFENAMWVSLESLGIGAGIINTVIKSLFRRERPFANKGEHHWDGPGLPNENSKLSFPSGDAATAWSALTAFSAMYGDPWYIAPWAYGLATLVSVARVHDRQHWPSDVFFSSSFAFFVSRALVKLHSKVCPAPLSPALLPGGGLGAAVTFRF